MRTIADRLQLIADETGMNDGAIAKATKRAISQQGVSKIRLGTTRQPSGETLAAIAKATGYRVEWLVSGRGAKRDADAQASAPISNSGLTDQQKRILLAGVREGLLQKGVDPATPEFVRLAATAYDKAESALLAEAEDAG
jgi:transcriptional regulator with XRE-family HTH domain